MNFFQTLRIALKALMLNKLRSFLTVLGVIIGVSAVIAMVAIGEGAKAQVAASFSSMGTNLLIVLPGSTSSGGQRGGYGSAPSLTWEDLKAIQTQVPTVRYAADQMRAGAQVRSQDQNWATSVIGTSPEFFSIRNWPVSSGQLWTQSDVDSATKVCVLGQTVVDNLYGPNYDPTGQTVLIENVPFTVMGVLAPKGQSSQGQDFDDVVYVPQTTYMEKIRGGLRKYMSGYVTIEADSEDDLPRCEQQVADLLRDRHHINQGEDDDFSIRNLTEIANAQQAGTQTLTMLLASIAAVSLLVGGIGIMNIMLVSVTERTREIGLRMAIGAKPHQILAQFLVEAVTLSLIGGLLGMGFGIAIAEGLATQMGWPILLSPQIMMIAVVFSGLVGVGFGMYPARKASQLSPIDALRFE